MVIVKQEKYGGSLTVKQLYEISEISSAVWDYLNDQNIIIFDLGLISYDERNSMKNDAKQDTCTAKAN